MFLVLTFCNVFILKERIFISIFIKNICHDGLFAKETGECITCAIGKCDITPKKLKQADPTRKITL